MTKEKEQTKNESTAHKRVPGDMNEGAAQSPDTGSMPMGMVGGEAGDPDPDQKSTRNAPNTLQSSLSDGSPKFEDIAPGRKRPHNPDAPHKKGGKFRVLSPIAIAYHSKDGKGEITGRQTHLHEVGEIVELDADTANSVHQHIEKL